MRIVNELTSGRVDKQTSKQVDELTSKQVITFATVLQLDYQLVHSSTHLLVNLFT